MKTLHLFAGAGGGLLADLILGHEPMGAVEIEPYCNSTYLNINRLLFNKDICLPFCPKFSRCSIHTARINAGVALGVLDRLAALSTTDRVVESC